MSLQLKYNIHQFCIQEIENQIAHYQKLIEITQEGAESENKSTAGDKHDTARAMMNIEKDKISAQLMQSLSMKKILLQIPSQSTKTIQIGSLVFTDSELFYISIGLGKVKIENIDCLIISPASPIGKELFGKKELDTFVFKNNKTIIQKII